MNWHRKKRGAQKLQVQGADVECLKHQIIDANEQEFTYGSNKELKVHLSNLRKEFHGSPEINFLVAQLIVYIRREIDLKQSWTSLQQLFEGELEFLLKSLSTRWLLSVTDSYADYSEDAAERAAAVACAVLVNSVKLQESERFVTETTEAEYIPEKMEWIAKNRLDLHDGTAGFAIGTDDTLRHQLWRIQQISEDTVCGKVLHEIFERMNDHDTVYGRFKDKHHRPKTAWW